MCNRTILDMVHGEESWLHLAVSFCILNKPSIFWAVLVVFHRTVWILHCKVTSVTELWRRNLLVVVERNWVCYVYLESFPSFSLFLPSLSSIVSFILFFWFPLSSLTWWYFQLLIFSAILCFPLAEILPVLYAPSFLLNFTEISS